MVLNLVVESQDLVGLHSNFAETTFLNISTMEA